MALPKTREQFGNFCLRKLGHPVIKINVAETQVDDCIDQALYHFTMYHYDGQEHRVLAYYPTDTDIANGYILLPEEIFSVERVMPIGGITGSTIDSAFFNYEYQVMQSDLLNRTGLFSATGGQLNYLETTLSYLSLINKMFSPEITFNYNRKNNKLYIQRNLSETYVIIIYFTKILDYSDSNSLAFERIWQDFWLQEYTTALIKKQWGVNLSKFIGTKLPGDLSVNAEGILREAKEEIKELERQLREEYELPPSVLVG